MCAAQWQRREASQATNRNIVSTLWLVCSTRARGISAKMEGLGMRNEKNSLDKVNALMITGNGETDKQV